MKKLNNKEQTNTFKCNYWFNKNINKNITFLRDVISNLGYCKLLQTGFPNNNKSKGRIEEVATIK